MRHCWTNRRRYSQLLSESVSEYRHRQELLYHTEDEGVYECRGCGAELFRSTEKFHSHCGWPSFFSPLAEDRVRYLRDDSIPGRARVEVRCATCDGHLGHVFEGEGYDTPTDLRYCINSVSLRLRRP